MSGTDPMRDNRYWRIKSLYLRLVNLGVDDRRAILDAECSDDAGLKRSVERLLDSDIRFCTEPWDDLVAFRDHLGGPNAAQCTMPERIGQYTVLGLIAEGGMGTVYRARQSSPERIVALKVLRSGLFPAMLRQRLEQESRVLARLEHPGIARVYEAGSFETEFGTLPFLSMEFVDGPTLQEYMTISRLSVPDRVHLVIELCDAIAHAHRRGVIHRDLKPRNILIDSDNRAKVVDFGIARLLDPDLEHATMHTTHGQLLGTLPYMSPEQASGLPEEIDTRSDLYALGVIAYELLACRLPFRFENESIHDALRTIQEIEPTPIERLDKRLRGDLSRVVAKAMAKEKERRYGSVSEFADDLRRYLRDEPITARPPAIGYRLGKFARRHRAPVAFGIIAALALLVGTSTAVWMAVERAAEAETLREVNSFWNDLLGAPNPAESVLGPDAHLEVSVVDYLDKASRRLGTIYSDSPKVEAELRSTIGTTYAALDQPERALPELRRAFDLYQASYGARHIKTLASRTRLGTVYAACGGLDEAEKIFTETLPSLEKAGGPGHETVIDCLVQLSKINTARGDFDSASMFLDRAMSRVRSEGLDKTPQGLDVIEETAFNRMRSEHYAEAEDLLTEFIDLSAEVYHEAHPKRLAALSVSAELSWRWGRHEEALEKLRQVFEIRKRVYGPDHSLTLGTQANIGQVLFSSGRRDEGIATLERVLGIMLENGRDDEDFGVIETRSNLGRLLYVDEQYERGESMNRAALSAIDRVRGPDAPRAMSTLNHLAGCIMHGRGIEPAEPFYDDLRARVDRVYRERIDGREAALRISLGKYYRAAGRWDEAVAELERAYEVATRLSRTKLSRTAARLLAEGFTEKGSEAEADRWLVRSRGG